MAPMIETIRGIYEVFDQLNLSVWGVLGIAFVLFVAFLFAVREAASWFFKVDDLKRDIQDLREVSQELRAELHTLQSLIQQLKGPAQNASPVAPTVPEYAPEEKPSKPSGLFTITH